LAQPSIKLIEGAFIFRFTHFIEWDLKSKEFNLCIYKDRDIFNSLKKRTHGKSVKGNNINIVNVDAKSLNTCHMLFLGKAISEPKISKELLKHKKIFVVSREASKDDTSMINLKIKESKLSFDANKTLMNKMKINISSKILRLADKVY